jgi:hypothetical protein
MQRTRLSVCVLMLRRLFEGPPIGKGARENLPSAQSAFAGRCTAQIAAAKRQTSLRDPPVPRYGPLGRLNAGIEPLRKFLALQKFPYVMGATSSVMKKYRPQEFPFAGEIEISNPRAAI